MGGITDTWYYVSDGLTATYYASAGSWLTPASIDHNCDSLYSNHVVPSDTISVDSSEGGLEGMLYNNERGCFVAPNNPNHTWYVGGEVVSPGGKILIPPLVTDADGIPANQGALLFLKGQVGLDDGMYEVWQSPAPLSSGDDYEPGIDTAPTTPRLVVVRLERHTPIEGDSDG